MKSPVDIRDLYAHIFFTILLLFLIFNYAFKDGIPTCNHYIINVYLYIALGFTFIGTLLYIYEKYQFKPNMIFFFANFIFVLILIFMIQMVQKEKMIVLNHILWLLILVGFTNMLYPMVSDSTLKPYINKTIMMVICIFVLMTVVTYVYPKFFESTYSMMMTGLMVGLISIILIELIDIMYKSVTGDWRMTGFNRGISYVVIVIFAILVSYDTTELNMKSRSCKESSLWNYPNYPSQSLALMLDLINLFVRILGLQRD
jgi:FtsH-binding integral membrane protein